MPERGDEILYDKNSQFCISFLAESEESVRVLECCQQNSRTRARFGHAACVACVHERDGPGMSECEQELIAC